MTGSRAPLVRPARPQPRRHGADPGRVEPSPTTTSATGSSSAPTTARSSTIDASGLDGVTSPELAALVAPPAAFGQRRRRGSRQLFVSRDGRHAARRDDGRPARSRSTPTRPRRSATSSSPGSATSRRAARARSSRRRRARSRIRRPPRRSSPTLLGGDAATYEARLTSDRATGRSSPASAGADQRTNVQTRDRRRARWPASRSRTCRASRSPTRTGVDVRGGADGRRRDEHRARRRGVRAGATSPVDDARALRDDRRHDEGAPGEVATIVVGGDHGEGRPDPPARRCRCPARWPTVLYDDASEMVHVLGRTPDGSGSTIYVIEPHGNPARRLRRRPRCRSTRSPGRHRCRRRCTRPTTASRSSPSPPTGQVASVDVGNHAFAWRAAGRHRRRADGGAALPPHPDPLPPPRRSAVLVAIFALVDGMLFVQSRIGMNDVYVGVFIVAAYTLFAALWTGLLALARRVLGRDAAHRRAASGWRSPRSGSRCTRSAGSGC